MPTMKNSKDKGVTRDNILHLLRSDVASGSSSSRQALLRLLVTILSIAGALIFNAFSPLVVPLTLIGVTVAVILASVVLGYWRLRRKRVISQRELFGHLVMDVIFLVVIVYYTGGASNPLISYLLVLLAVGATLLTQFYVNIFAATSSPPPFRSRCRCADWNGNTFQKVLKENDGNISETARQLKMHRRTLQRKLQKRPVAR